MEIKRHKIDIENLYISKPLEKETFIKVLNENKFTIHELYLIANSLKSMHYFLSLENHPKYSITAYVSIKHGYCGEARSQISVIKNMQEKYKLRPYMSLVYKIIDKSNTKEIFSFSHETVNKNQIYNLIDEFYNKTEKLCKVNTF